MSFELSDTGQVWLWVCMGVYAAAMLVIGWRAGRRVCSMTDYLVAGRRLSFGASTATLLATWIGVGSCLGVTGTVYTEGVRGVLADPFGSGCCLILAGILVVGRLRRLGCQTVTDCIAQKYGRTAGIYASAWMMPVYIGWTGSLVKGLGVMLHVVTGISETWGTILGACVVVAYTCVGGMWAVTLTDIVQFVLILLGMGALLPYAVEAAGGFSGIESTLRSGDLALLPREFSSFEDGVYYVGNWMVMGLGCMVGQDLLQRSLSSRSEAVARTSSMASGVIYLLFGLIPIVIGFAARGILGAEGSIEGNQILPKVAIAVWGNHSPVLLALFLCALLAVIMSSADSALLAGTSLFCNNILRPMKPTWNEAKLLLVTRLTPLGLTALATTLALCVNSIYTLMINSWVTQLVIVLIPVLTAIYLPRSGRVTAWTAMISGTVIWLGYVIAVCMIRVESFWNCLTDGDVLDRAVNCGAVYAFFGAAVLTGLAYWGENAVNAREWQKRDLGPASLRSRHRTRPSTAMTRERRRRSF